MNIVLENIGPIHKIDLCDLNDLTLIYGKNNIGKSYAISILYLLIKNYSMDNIAFQRGYYNTELYWGNEIRKIVLDSLSSIDLNCDGDQKGDSVVTEMFTRALESFLIDKIENSFSNSFNSIGSMQSTFTDEPAEITLYFKKFKFTIVIRDSKLAITRFQYRNHVSFRKITVNRTFKEHGLNETTIIYFKDQESLLANSSAFLNQLYYESILEVLSKTKSVYFLPASRSGLYRAMNSFSSMLAEFSKMRNFFRTKLSIPSISEQDLDYFTKINEIRTKKTNENFTEVIFDLEKKLLKGEVSFDTKEKRILYKPYNSSMVMEIIGTSSMVAEISPIVVYLKYIIGNDEESYRIRRLNLKSKPLVFIEEPEAHLHPEAQVALVSALIKMVEHGCKIIITSHSNYIFNALNNNLITNESLKNNTTSLLFSDTDKGCISERLEVNEIGIDDKNFMETTELLYNDRINAINKKNEDLL